MFLHLLLPAMARSRGYIRHRVGAQGMRWRENRWWWLLCRRGGRRRAQVRRACRREEVGSLDDTNFPLFVERPVARTGTRPPARRAQEKSRRRGADCKTARRQSVELGFPPGRAKVGWLGREWAAGWAYWPGSDGSSSPSFFLLKQFSFYLFFLFCFKPFTCSF
jgi:hypothetical protein